MGSYSRTRKRHHPLRPTAAAQVASPEQRTSGGNTIGDSSSGAKSQEAFRNELSEAKEKISHLVAESEQGKAKLHNYRRLISKYEEEHALLESKIQELEEERAATTTIAPPHAPPPSIQIIAPPSQPVTNASPALTSSSTNNPTTKLSSADAQKTPAAAGTPHPSSAEILQSLDVSSLPPSLASAVLEYREKHAERAINTLGGNLRGNLRSIWFMRILALAAGEVCAILLFTYSFIYVSTYLQYANTTSEFPWSWQQNYSSAGPMWNQFYLGLGISVATLVACMIAQVYIFQYKIRPLALKQNR